MHGQTRRQALFLPAATTFALTVGLAVLLAAACTPKTPDQPVAQPVKVLEITSDAKGMFDVIGKSMHFRLFSDGTVEFEVPDDTKKSSPISNSAEVNVLRHVNLNDAEKARLTEAVRALTNTEIEQNYKRKCCCVDTQVDLTISLDNGRSVALAGYCEIGEIVNLETESTRQLPPAVTNLLAAVENVRSKYRRPSN